MTLHDAEAMVQGYARGPNRFGIRNHIAVVPTTFCTNNLAQRVAAHFQELRFGAEKENRVVPLTHGVGCCSVGFDEQLSLRILERACKNPNIGAVVTLSLGCGSYCSSCGAAGQSNRGGKLIKGIEPAGPHREEVVVQRPGGSKAAFDEAVKTIEKLVKTLDNQKRTPQPARRLVIGVMNGSSDPTSGLFSNPATGYFCDWHMARGGRVVFSQTLETLGAEDVLLARARDERVNNRLTRLLTTVTLMRRAVESEGVESEPTAGNIRGGISTLAEKSVGTVFKIGHDSAHQIVDVLAHGETVGNNSGIYLVDGPGQDILCLSGLMAAGCHQVIFTTGRGTPTGSGIVPTIKVTANKDTYERMDCDIDLCFDVNAIFAERRLLKDIAIEALVPFVNDVASGKALTSAERRGQSDFQVRQLWLID